MYRLSPRAIHFLSVFCDGACALRVQAVVSLSWGSPLLFGNKSFLLLEKLSHLLISPTLQSACKPTFTQSTRKSNYCGLRGYGYDDT